jgi:hypothetical protein
MVEPVLSVRFFKTETGAEPERDCLLGMSYRDRETIGTDIETVQFGWPRVRKMEKDWWKIRIHLEGGRIARILFAVDAPILVPLRGFIKKSRTPPKEDSVFLKPRAIPFFFSGGKGGRMRVSSDKDEKR